jgi:hypothetical protein
MSYKRRKTSDVPQRDTNRVTPVATEGSLNLLFARLCLTQFFPRLSR